MQVSWQGSDAAGRPVLLVRLSRACDEFDGKAARQCAEAIISHVRALVPCRIPERRFRSWLCHMLCSF